MPHDIQKRIITSRLKLAFVIVLGYQPNVLMGLSDPDMNLCVHTIVKDTKNVQAGSRKGKDLFTVTKHVNNLLVNKIHYSVKCNIFILI